jgi:SAM-dependent methyltransferase
LHGQDRLDASCGSDTLARYLVESGARVLAVDVAEEMIATARELASRDVASHDVVNHDAVNQAEPDTAACLAEFARVLRPAACCLFCSEPHFADPQSPGRDAPAVAAPRAKMVYVSRLLAQRVRSRRLLRLVEPAWVRHGVIPFGRPIPPMVAAPASSEACCWLFALCASYAAERAPAGIHAIRDRFLQFHHNLDLELCSGTGTQVIC